MKYRWISLVFLVRTYSEQPTRLQQAGGILTMVGAHRAVLSFLQQSKSSNEPIPVHGFWIGSIPRADAAVAQTSQSIYFSTRALLLR